MSKVKTGPRLWLYPLPVVVIGANVDEKPNFMAAGWCGIACSEPPVLTVGIRPERYTMKGIRQNMAFSVNVPSADLVRETDYCGISAGDKEDKVKICGFKVFYGRLNNAPLIEQFPINMECRVVHILELGSHLLVVGEIVETHVNEELLKDGQPDMDAIKPFAYLHQQGPGGAYVSLGKTLGISHTTGRELKTIYQ